MPAHETGASSLPLLLALSASSPFCADGSDTGYCSVRTLVWQRWPTTSPCAPVNSAAKYDALIADLERSGVITDLGMAYFDVRPAMKVPTLKLRICDSWPSVETVVLIAGLFRALVDEEATRLHAGERAPSISPIMVRAAAWRAARSGLEGDLVDVLRPAARPATQVMTAFIDALRAQLVESGDWPQVHELANRALRAGISAARQRRAMQCRDELTDVVDQLIDETVTCARNDAATRKKVDGSHP